LKTLSGIAIEQQCTSQHDKRIQQLSTTPDLLNFGTMDFASDNASAASMNEIIRFILESESDSAVTLTEATSGGSSFIIHMSGTGTSTFGHLESEKGSKLVDAVQHDGKMYMNVTQATYVEAMLAEAKGSPVSQSEFIQATSLAMPLLLQGNQAVNKLVTDPPVIARWQTFRQACCAIEAAVEITTRAKHVPDYMKRWLQIACNSESAVLDSH
jgi:hypothetical protein